MKDVGEPCAGELLARFDGRALETEQPRQGIRGPRAGALRNATTTAWAGTTSPDQLSPRQRSTQPTSAGRKTELLEFLRWDAEVARAQEPGTLRFDVWQVPDEPDAVYLYEAFVDQAAFEAHQKSEPFKKFVAEIVPNVIEPVIFVLPFAESTVSITEA